MTFAQLFGLLKSVLISPEVIGVTIVIALYINIVTYIVRYRKQPPREKKKKVKAEPAAPAGPTAAERAGRGAPPDDDEPAGK